jgi:hypothetical protein
VSGHLHAPAALTAGKNLRSYWIGGWVGPQDRSGRFWKGKDSLAFIGIRSPNRLSHSLVTILTELSQFELVLMKLKVVMYFFLRMEIFVFVDGRSYWEPCHLISGHAVVQLVEAVRYKPEGRGFGIFHWHNPSGCTVTLGLTQPLTEMSKRNISWGVKGGRCVGLTTLPPSWADFLERLGVSNSWNPHVVSRPVLGLLCRLIYGGMQDVRRASWRGHISRLILDHFHFGRGCPQTHVPPEGYHSPSRAISKKNELL